MKTYRLRTGIFVFIYLGMMVVSSYGQRHRMGQFATSLSTGIMDRIPTGLWFKNDQQGLLASVDFVRYTQAEHYWKIGYQYDRKYYVPLADYTLQSERHTLEFAYAPMSVHNYQRSFYISPILGIFSGIETINQDRRELPVGLITAQGRFTFGSSFGLEGEVYLTDKFSLVGGLIERWYGVTDLSRLHTQAQVGLRFTFNSL